MTENTRIQNIGKLFKAVFYKNKRLFLFLIYAVLLYLGWLFFYKVFKNVRIVFDLYEIGINYFSNALLYASHYFMLIFGEESIISIPNQTIKSIDGGLVHIARGCLGRNLMSLFAGFIIAYPGNWRDKLWYIPLGFSIIFFLNILRVFGILMVLKYDPQSFHKYDHHQLFNYAVYLMTFVMWVIWVTKYSKRRQKR